MNYGTKQERQDELYDAHMEQVGNRVRAASDDELVQWAQDMVMGFGLTDVHREALFELEENHAAALLRFLVGTEGLIFENLCDHVSKLMQERKL